MKRTLQYLFLLILMFFLPTKTADIIIKIDNEKEKSNWVFNTTMDTSSIEKVDISTQNTTEKQASNNWWKYPDEIYPTKRNGDDLLILVNKQYKLPSTYAPSDLVKASNSGIRRGENYYLRNILINDLTNLVNDAKSIGIDLSMVSGYRSYDTQLIKYNSWLIKNSNNISYVDTFSARAGHSQHQLGTAIDFSSSEIGDRIGDEFTNTNASKWLIENAHKYGFVLSYPKGYEHITGYKHESWHYRYIGVEYAKELKNTGLILEEYLQTYNP